MVETDDEKNNTVLREAEALIYGAWADEYGPPRENFERLAKLWSAYLGPRVAVNAPLTAYDVAWMLLLLKVSRAARDRGAKTKRDTVVDAAGYVGCVERISEG